MVGRAQERGHLKAGSGGRRGCRRPSAWRPWGCYCWTFRPALRCGSGACLDQCGVSGIRASPQTQAARRSAPDHGQRSDELPEPGEITVAAKPGAHAATFSAPRGCPTSRRKPGEIHFADRRNRDGSEPRYYLSNAPEIPRWTTLAYVGGSRWRIETLRRRKAT